MSPSTLESRKGSAVDTARVDERKREVLEHGYDALSRGDIDAALEDIDPEIEVVTSGAFLDEGTVYRGHDGLRQFFAMLLDAFDYLDYEIEEMVELDDERVLVTFRLHTRGKGSGLDVEREGAHVWTMRDYKGTRLVAYAAVEEARTAEGLT
jgi:ketosteroid isomerase-like protein